jgi:DNA-binding beta-propeller fold protein YncE
MKSNFFILLVLITAAVGCKKYPYPGNGKLPGEKKWIVTTVAGNGIAHFADGPNPIAEFNAPQDIVINDDGIIYVADAINHRIRKIEAGEVSTFAGSGVQDTAGGIGTAAGFAHPIRLTIDASGNLYTLDVNDFRVRKITPAAVVTVAAGNGVREFRDGRIDSAEFGESLGIVVDRQSNIYVSDWENKRIRKINTSGQVTTILGPLQSGLGGITIDRQDNLYVADINNFRLLKITTDGNVHVFAGTGVFGFKDGNAQEAMFGSINDIVADEQDNIYVSDENRIRKITQQGVVSTIAGSVSGYQDGDGLSAKFNLPNGLAVDKQGNIYVADNNNNRIRKISFQ